jgi:hypothetical protein
MLTYYQQIVSRDTSKISLVTISEIGNQEIIQPKSSQEDFTL